GLLTVAVDRREGPDADAATQQGGRAGITVSANVHVMDNARHLGLAPTLPDVQRADDVGPTLAAVRDAARVGAGQRSEVGAAPARQLRASAREAVRARALRRDGGREAAAKRGGVGNLDRLVEALLFGFAGKGLNGFLQRSVDVLKPACVLVPRRLQSNEVVLERLRQYLCRRVTGSQALGGRPHGRGDRIRRCRYPPRRFQKRARRPIDPFRYALECRGRRVGLVHRFLRGASDPGEGLLGRRHRIGHAFDVGPKAPQNFPQALAYGVSGFAGRFGRAFEDALSVSGGLLCPLGEIVLKSLQSGPKRLHLRRQVSEYFLQGGVQGGIGALAGPVCVFLQLPTHVVGRAGERFQCLLDRGATTLSRLAKLSTGPRHDRDKRVTRLAHLRGEPVARFGQVDTHAFQSVGRGPQDFDELGHLLARASPQRLHELSNETFESLFPVIIKTGSERTYGGTDGMSDFLAKRLPKPLHILGGRHLLEQRHLFALSVQRPESKSLRRHYAKSRLQRAAEPLESALNQDAVCSEQKTQSQRREQSGDRRRELESRRVEEILQRSGHLVRGRAASVSGLRKRDYQSDERQQQSNTDEIAGHTRHQTQPEHVIPGD